jgi:Sulfotransferase domain
VSREPNFFVIGAPKCGTTSLASWLAAHPAVFMARLKEPCFFNFDVGQRHISTELQYRLLFEDVETHHIAVGEASTAYLRSRRAVPEIVARFPNAKFIVMLRNPVEMVLSLYQQELKTLNETLPFDAAWVAQGDRARGKGIPLLCSDRSLLNYKERASTGTQLQFVSQMVKRHNLLILFFDDVLATPNLVYRDVLSFLGLPADGRTDFSAQNASAEPKSRTAEFALRLIFQLKQKIGVRGGTGLLRPLADWNRRAVAKLSITDIRRRELIECFHAEIELLSALSGRDLRHWLE